MKQGQLLKKEDGDWLSIRTMSIKISPRNMTIAMAGVRNV
jgi:hypothetical protein